MRGKKGKGLRENGCFSHVTVTIRTTAIYFSTLMSNINPHFRKFDSNFAAEEEENPPVLFHAEATRTGGKSLCLLFSGSEGVNRTKRKFYTV